MGEFYSDKLANIVKIMKDVEKVYGKEMFENGKKDEEILPIIIDKLKKDALENKLNELVNYSDQLKNIYSSGDLEKMLNDVEKEISQFFNHQIFDGQPIKKSVLHSTNQIETHLRKAIEVKDRENTTSSGGRRKTRKNKRKTRGKKRKTRGKKRKTHRRRR